MPARHDALRYRDEAELLRAAVPFVREGLAAGDSVVLLCRPDNARRLRQALGDVRVTAELSPDDVYGGAVAALAAYRELVERQQHGGARVRVVNEIDFGSRPSAQWEWARFDAAFNQALAAYPIWNLCLYDQRRVPAEIVRAAASSHPFLLTDGDRVPSAGYTEPSRLLGEPGMRWRDPLEDAAPRVDVTDPADLAALRAAVERTLTGDGMAAHAVQGFVLAVSEIATNAMTHGTAPVRVRLWSAGGRALCAISDEGDCFDPYSGYEPADRALGAGGMGLWLARQMSDDLSVDGSGGACTVRLGLNA
ncbi:sensor histidine kinase [Catellatospora sp. NPDC049609]|uniref:sensor histidine kinase n=1 Tax=Catellatospora sp. NPDC049609 TaxID=3155505 RepID=UPI0034348C01